VVVSQSKNASEAGVAVLDTGGNAIDAALPRWRSPRSSFSGKAPIPTIFRQR
jgi:hypothetical protein